VVLCTSEPRKRRCNKQEQAGDAERSLKLDARFEPIEQNPCEKWEQKPGEVDVQLLCAKSPATNEVSTLPKDGELNEKNGCRKTNTLRALFESLRRPSA
jgi:hypothetical protein